MTMGGNGERWQRTWWVVGRCDDNGDGCAVLGDCLWRRRVVRGRRRRRLSVQMAMLTAVIAANERAMINGSNGGDGACQMCNAGALCCANAALILLMV